MVTPARPHAQDAQCPHLLGVECLAHIRCVCAFKAWLCTNPQPVGCKLTCLSVCPAGACQAPECPFQTPDPPLFQPATPAANCSAPMSILAYSSVLPTPSNTCAPPPRTHPPLPHPCSLIDASRKWQRIQEWVVQDSQGGGGAGGRGGGSAKHHLPPPPTSVGTAQDDDAVGGERRNIRVRVRGGRKG